MSIIHHCDPAPITRAPSQRFVKTAKQLVLAFRVNRGGFNVSVLGTGGGGQFETGFQQSPFVAPFMIVLRLLRELIVAARRHEKSFNGLLVHLNNLENLAQREATQAAAIVRDLRDVFLIDGFHYVVVGTPEAVRDVISAHAQVRSVFMVHKPLVSLSFAAFNRLLSLRYDYLKLDKSKPVHSPVEVAALRELYRVFAGDLRGLLRALNYAANQLLGYTGEQGAAPMTTQQILAVLRPYYREEIAANLGAPTMEYFQCLSGKVTQPFAQSDLCSWWKVSQSMVSKTVEELRKFGCVHEGSREGRKILYELSGAARLALDEPVQARRRK